MIRINRIITIFVISVYASSCSKNYITDYQLERIEIGMKKNDVLKRLGHGLRRGSVKNKFNQVVEVWEYKNQERPSPDDIAAQIFLTVCTLGLFLPLIGTGGETNKYWVYFVDGEMVRWGQSGDWAEAQKVIYDLNFKLDAS